MNTTPKSLVIFDLDGTLIDSVPDLTDAIDKTLLILGSCTAGEELVRTWVGNGSLKLVERAINWAGITLERLDEAHELFLTTYHNCHDNTTAYANVKEGLICLKQQGFKLAICTNKPTQFLPQILANMGWLDMFDCVVGGDTLSTKKPNPNPLYHICQTLSIDVCQSIMVGDSKNDILAGKSANMTTLALSYGYNYGESIAISKPDAIFDDFGSLVAFILNHHRDD
ncbi:phosphoglycolate phosphatase [Moraxella sp. ZY200743]|uniref:phosphoglycolate phosphatase n=1 Tax=Moraxella sp. ZY200743 TaxID=2911970 RepID=UPI003D7DE710